MDEDDITSFPVGSLVQTPTGRIGVVVAWTYGQFGDVPRCSVRYLDSRDSREMARLVPRLLKMLVRGPIFLKAISGWKHDES